MELFSTKFSAAIGGYAVLDYKGNAIIAYKSVKLAAEAARGHTLSVFTAAEVENDRRDGIKTYLAIRAARVPAVDNQLSFEF